MKKKLSLGAILLVVAVGIASALPKGVKEVVGGGHHTNTGLTFGVTTTTAMPITQSVSYRENHGRRNEL